MPVRGPKPDSLRRFATILTLLLVFFAVLPDIAGWIAAGSSYIGYPYATDDHMVYSAWTHQGIEGRLFFENRFTFDAQLGLTIHIYFWILGFVAKFIGIHGATVFARVSLGIALVQLLRLLVERLMTNLFTAKLALVLATTGAGFGCLVFQRLGNGLPDAHPLKAIFPQTSPIDIWQPEAFLFPSLLTNALFVAAFVLVLGIFLCVLESEHSWKPVFPGALGFLILMNIHSYDALLMALVLVGFLACQLSAKRWSWAWVARVAVMGAGALPSAFWFLHVLAEDKVFQARAATPTMAPSFVSILAGLGLLFVFGAWGIVSRFGSPPHKRMGVWILGGTALLTIFLSREGQGLSAPGAWVLLIALTLLGISRLATDSPAWNLVLSWALVGLTAVYFPAMFQRKLATAIEIPWALLAAPTLCVLMRPQTSMQVKRNFAAAALLLMCGATSVDWLTRELWFIKTGQTNTIVHPLYLTGDMGQIMRAIEKMPKPVRVVCPPGVPGVGVDGEYGLPIMPDLNPVVTGLAGATTYAGHWSETPEYPARRAELSSVLYAGKWDQDRAQSFIRQNHVDYIVAPVPEAYPSLNYHDLRSLGNVEVGGKDFWLIRVSK